LSSFVSVVLVLLAGFFAYVLVQMWPPSVPAGGTVPATSRFNLFAIKFTLSQDKDFLILLAAAGALGAMAHVLRSFYVYAGERKLVKSWLISYFLIPEVGAIVAVVVYIVLRGGLIAGGVAQQNPFGFAAVGVLVGMFSSQALEMLKKVFETLFAATPPKSEHYQDLPPSVSSFDPPSGPTQSKVTISGSNLSDTNAVPPLPVSLDTRLDNWRSDGNRESGGGRTGRWEQGGSMVGQAQGRRGDAPAPR